MLSLEEVKSKADAKAQRRAVELQIVAAMPADSSGLEIVAALRQTPGTVTANQQAANDRAKHRRVAKGQANKAKFEAKVALRRAAKEQVRQDAADAKAARFAAVVAATVW